MKLWGNLDTHLNLHLCIAPHGCPDFITVQDPGNIFFTGLMPCPVKSGDRAHIHRHRKKDHGYVARSRASNKGSTKLDVKTTNIQPSVDTFKGIQPRPSSSHSAGPSRTTRVRKTAKPYATPSSPPQIPVQNSSMGTLHLPEIFSTPAQGCSFASSSPFALDTSVALSSTSNSPPQYVGEQYHGLPWSTDYSPSSSSSHTSSRASSPWSSDYHSTPSPIYTGAASPATAYNWEVPCSSSPAGMDILPYDELSSTPPVTVSKKLLAPEVLDLLDDSLLTFASSVGINFTL